KPLLCDGDGPILQFRQWFRQFYVADQDVLGKI
ncbi:MAG: FeS-binding protein, partial [Nevskia sp.]|nr:FeS-binding protein [Nevskia sp.]